MNAELIDPHDVTDRQAAILEFIREHLAANGYPPTIREIGDAVGLTSTSSVHNQLRSLERSGAIVRTGHAARAIALVDAAGVAA